MPRESGHQLVRVETGRTEEAPAVIVTLSEGSEDAHIESRIVFDQDKKRWLLRSNKSDNDAVNLDEVYQPCFSARDDLLAAANKYCRKRKQPPLELASMHTWTEVEASLQSACGVLEKLGEEDKALSGATGKLKGAFRALCRYAGAGQTFASLIPNDSFSFASVLCGGLKVVFSGLQAIGVYREDIYRVLEELPFILSDHAVHGGLSVYNEDEELHRRAASLYVAVFEIIQRVLMWFVKNSFVTGVKIVIDPSGFSDKLKDLLAEVKTKAQRFDHRALELSRRCQSESVELLCWTAYVQKNMARNVETILARTEALEEKIARTEVLERLDPLLPPLQRIVARSGKALPPARQAQGVQRPEDIRGEILENFHHNPNLVRNDCAVLSRLHRRAPRLNIDEDRIEALQSSPRLRAWLVVDSPSMLLINGRASRPRPASETTLVSAKIVERLLAQNCDNNPGNGRSHSPHVIPLAFFCGQHSRGIDTNGSPTAVALNLLLQLVDLGGAGNLLSAPALLKCRKETKPNVLSSICSSFRDLVMTLGPDVFLVIVIDGLKFLAQSAQRRAETRELVLSLVGVYRERPRATLKFLFASPTRSEFLEDLFAGDENLSVPRGIRHRGREGASRRKVLEFRASERQGSRLESEDEDDEEDADDKTSDEDSG